MSSNQSLYDIILDKTTLGSDDNANKEIMFAAVTDVMKTKPKLIDFQTGWNLNNFLHSNLLFTLDEYNNELMHMKESYQGKSYIVQDFPTFEQLKRSTHDDFGALIAVIEVNNRVTFRVLSVEEAIIIAVEGFDVFKRNA